MSLNGPRARPGPWPLGGALVVLAGSTALALARVEPFKSWYYHFAWYSTLLALDAGLAWREGPAPLLGRPRFALSLWLWSIPTWLVFEALNLRIANWYYVFAPGDLAARRVNAALAFGTVLPAIHLGHRWLASLDVLSGWRGRGFSPARRLPAGVFLAGVAFLALALWRPPLFFPLVWGATTLLLEPWNYRSDPDASLLGDLARGRYARIGRLLLAGAAIGVLWETFNSVASTRWIYTVPGLEEGKVFEMPVLGYLGFPVFALDCFVIYRALVNLGVAVPGWARGREEPEGGRRTAPAGRTVPAGRRRAGGGRGGGGRTAVAAAAAALFSLAVLQGVDRWTVDSWYPEIRDLPGIPASAVAALVAAGVDGVPELARMRPAEIARGAGIPPRVAEEAVEVARLAALRGLGAENATALRRAGIGSVCELARAEPARVAAAVRAVRDDPRAGFAPRVRVWVRAAGRACGEDSEG